MSKNILWVDVVIALKKAQAADKAAGWWVSPAAGYGIAKALMNADAVLATKPKHALAIVESYA
jgi:hypothetical protein